MKNIIPVITAVILGLAAVFAVSRVLKKQEKHPETLVPIVAAGIDFKAGQTIHEEDLIVRRVPVSALPQQYIHYQNRQILEGQQTLGPIAKQDFVLLSNIGLSSSMGNLIGQGEWGVPVTFSDSTLLSILQPGDEIAIVGIFDVQKVTNVPKDANARPVVTSQTVSTVLYPRVRILEKVGRDSIILSMPPQQAIALINLQEKCKLFPMLRRTNDTRSLNRKDGGIFENSTLTHLVDDLDLIEIPTEAREIAPATQPQ